jgi:hypothetical protein
MPMMGGGDQGAFAEFLALRSRGQLSRQQIMATEADQVWVWLDEALPPYQKGLDAANARHEAHKAATKKAPDPAAVEARLRDMEKEMNLPAGTLKADAAGNVYGRGEIADSTPDMSPKLMSDLRDALGDNPRDQEQP